MEVLAARADEPVLTDGPTGRAVTGAELSAAIRAVAGGLAARGIGRGSVVALMLPNGAEFCAAFHAVLWGGGTVTPVNPAYTAPELARQLESSGATLLIADAAQVDTVTGAGLPPGRVMLIDHGAADPLEPLKGAEQAAQHPVDLWRDLALLPYSSGTTGVPKGVMLPHGNLVENLAQTQSVLEVAPGEATLAFLPFFHIYGLATVMNAFLMKGGRLVTQPRFDLAQAVRLIEAHAIRQLFIVPPVATMLVGHPAAAQADLSSLRWILSAAAPLDAGLLRALEARLPGCVVSEGFGMTELSSFSHIAPRHAARDGSCGPVLPGTEVRIADPETGAALGPGETGELWLRGPQVMAGYHGAPGATAAAKTPEGWLRSGDLAELDDDGHLFLRGRIKDVVKVKGFQVSPVEVEAALLAHPGIIDAGVVGLPAPGGGEMLAAVLVARGPAPARDDVLACLAPRLASYKLPRRLLYDSEIPRSPAGKIARATLRERALSLGSEASE